MSRRPLAALALASLAALVFAPFAGAAGGGAPNDPLFTSGPQWGLTMVGAPQAWATSTGRGITIGIVDTGVDLTHQDLASHVTASTSCVGSNGDPTHCHGTGQDDNGHGTHVAGIAAAVTNNAVGVAGMAPDAHLVVAKVLDSSGSGTVADVTAGIEWVVDHGARVVNLSLGDANTLFTSQFGASLQPVIESAWTQGAIPVLASGNSAILGFGGSSDYGDLHAVVVGAVGRDGGLTGYSSSTGTAKWALLAPGGSADGVQGDDILSTYWLSGKSNQYGYLAGTSMATPFVSGTLALLLAAGLSPSQAVSHLLSTANGAVSCGLDSKYCKGLLNAAAAVAGLKSGGTPTTTTTTITAPQVIPAPTTTTTTTVKAPPVNFPPPAVVHAAPPAVMVPSHTPTTHPQNHQTSQPGGAPTGATPTTSPRAGDAASKVLVGLASTARHHSTTSSLGWFALLAAGFAALVAAGIVRVMRAVPDGEE